MGADGDTVVAGFAGDCHLFDMLGQAFVERVARRVLRIDEESQAHAALQWLEIGLLA